MTGSSWTPTQGNWIGKSLIKKFFLSVDDDVNYLTAPTFVPYIVHFRQEHETQRGCGWCQNNWCDDDEGQSDSLGEQIRQHHHTHARYHGAVDWEADVLRVVERRDFNVARLPRHVHADHQQEALVSVEHAQPALRMQTLTDFHLNARDKLSFTWWQSGNCILREIYVLFVPIVDDRKLVQTAGGGKQSCFWLLSISPSFAFDIISGMSFPRKCSLRNGDFDPSAGMEMWMRYRTCL